jgi:organic hydroperoxide reductase OsmC/OhrA
MHSRHPTDGRKIMTSSYRVSMDLVDGYRFDVDLGVEGTGVLRMDEPPPLGEGAGPNAARLLAAAVGNCLASSALFCLRKARIDVRGMSAAVKAETGRNEKGRVRIHRIDVALYPEVSEEDGERIGRCMTLFEDFCMVTESVRGGIEVDVDVEPVIAADVVTST